MIQLSPFSTVRRRFSLPVALSLGLHGLAVAALGVFSLPPSISTTAPPSTVAVMLVPPPSAPAAPPERKAQRAVTKAAPARPMPVKRAVRHAVVAAPKRVRAVAVRVARPSVAAPVAASAAPVAEVAAATEPMPGFKELPRAWAPASPPSAAYRESAMFALPEVTDSPGALLMVNAGAGTISRPLAAASSDGVRLLRDPTAEGGLVRSKVRSGNNPRPDYPRPAREAGWEGTVVLQVAVMPDGTAGSVVLHKTSGHAILDEAALSAVKDWRFIPAMDGNFPVSSIVRLPVKFDLKAAD